MKSRFMGVSGQEAWNTNIAAAAANIATVVRPTVHSPSRELGCPRISVTSDATNRRTKQEERREQAIEHCAPVQRLHGIDARKIEGDPRRDRREDDEIERPRGGIVIVHASRQPNVSASAYAAEPARIGMASAPVPTSPRV